MGPGTPDGPPAPADAIDPIASRSPEDLAAAPLLLAIDGNSLLHRAYHSQAGTAARNPDGAPCWALAGLWSELLAAVDRLDPAAVVLGFDDPDVNDRKTMHPGYKAHRGDKHGDLVEQLAAAPGHFGRAGITVVVAPGAEADDVLASAAATAARSGWRCAVTTSDRDAFALISQTTSVLRILNGGVEASPVLTPQRLQILAGIRPEQYLEYAALRGDTSDNLPGVPGIGPKTAVRLLAAYPTLSQAWAELDAGGTGVAAVIGTANAARLGEDESRERVALNVGLMAMRTDLALPALPAMALPIPAEPLLAELAAWGLNAARWWAVRLLTDAPVDYGRPPVPAPPPPRAQQLSLFD